MIRSHRLPLLESTAPLLVLTGLVTLVGLWLPFSAVGAAVGLVPVPLPFFPGWWRHWPPIAC